MDDLQLIAVYSQGLKSAVAGWRRRLSLQLGKALLRFARGPRCLCVGCNFEMKRSEFEVQYNKFGWVFAYQWWECPCCGRRTPTEYSSSL